MEFKSVEDDFVTYKIFPGEEEFNNLTELREKCLNVISKYVANYMWHHDRFVLNIEPGSKYLSGKVVISDNIEDEWFIISLLFLISEQVEDVVIQVNDQDGEVLLIEAAEYIPKWAQEPDLAENRVFIYKNAIHLIPVAKSPAELTPLPSGCPDVEDAIHTVIKHCEITKASEQVQKAIRERLKSYPKDFSSMMHYTHVIIPKKLKKIMSKCPHLIPKAIRLFYNRDPIDLKTCRLMKNFNPKENGLEKCGLKVTKCLFAMLSQQNFYPDKKAGWPNLSKTDHDYKPLNLGSKLACGFEILANCKTHREDIEEAFIQNLTNNGYFQGEMKGSRKYDELYNQAKSHFEDRNLDSEIKTPVMELHELLETIDEIEDVEETLDPPGDESWLDLEPETFDKMLENHFKLQSESNSSQQKSKESIPSEVKNFLKAMSDLQGVEEMKDKITENNPDAIDFKPDEFETAFKKILGFENDPSESDSEAEDDDIDFDEAFENNDEMAEYFSKMNQELHGTNVTKEADDDNEANDDEWSKPLDIDAKLLSNLMESYRGQGGMPGPASTLLEPLGINLKK